MRFMTVRGIAVDMIQAGRGISLQQFTIVGCLPHKISCLIWTITIFISGLFR